MPGLSLFIALLNAAIVLGTCVPAGAVLGEPAQSVGTDAQALGGKAHLLAQGQASYTVEQFTTTDGIAVREYVAPSSMIVFAVAWNGPHPPDLSALLGSYFADYKSMAAQTQGTNDLHHRSLRGSRLVIQTAGHMRDMWGRAWDPQLLPPGVTEEDIR